MKGFDDHAVHDVLTRSGIKKYFFSEDISADEWFECDLATAKNAITAVKEGRKSLLPSETSNSQDPIIFRPEQREAIDKTLRQFRRGKQMLWNAKMRFGKTLSALQMVKEYGNFRRILILTHRPVVDAGWYEDFKKIYYDTDEYAYGSKTNGETFESLERRASREECRYVYFASMQDLRGSELVGGKFDKKKTKTTVGSSTSPKSSLPPTAFSLLSAPNGVTSSRNSKNTSPTLSAGPLMK